MACNLVYLSAFTRRQVSSTSSCKKLHGFSHSLWQIGCSCLFGRFAQDTLWIRRAITLTETSKHYVANQPEQTRETQIPHPKQRKEHKHK